MCPSRPRHHDWSVVIPCYRPNEIWLPEAIHSAIAAGCSEHNIILAIDDPQDDSTGPVAQALAEVRVLRHTTNSGVAAARRTGLEAVSTEFVTFLDQDDCFTPAMTRAVRLAHRLGERSAVVGGMATTGAGGAISRYRQRAWPTRTVTWTTASLDLMLENAQIGRWVIPTDIARRCEFTDNREIDDASDLAFVSAVAGICDIAIMPETVLLYRHHADQVSMRAGSAMTEPEQRKLEALLADAARSRFSARAVRRRLRSRRHYWAAARAHREGAGFRALGHAAAAMGADFTVWRSPIARSSLLLTTGRIAKGLLVTHNRRRGRWSDT
jgi:hypothetical protein